MTTNPSALERARNSPRVQRALRGMTRTIFFLTIAAISLAWTMMVPLVLFSAEPDLLRVAALFVVPGGVWLIVWYDRREDAKEAASAPRHAKSSGVK
jgi:hypothetical protein